MSRHNGNATKKNGAFNLKRNAQGNLLTERCVRPWKITQGSAGDPAGDTRKRIRGKGSGHGEAPGAAGSRGERGSSAPSSLGHFWQPPSWERGFYLGSFIAILGCGRRVAFIFGPSSEILHFTEKLMNFRAARAPPGWFLEHEGEQVQPGGGSPGKGEDPQPPGNGSIQILPVRGPGLHLRLAFLCASFDSTNWPASCRETQVPC